VGLENGRRSLTTCSIVARTRKWATNMALALQWLQITLIQPVMTVHPIKSPIKPTQTVPKVLLEVGNKGQRVLVVILEVGNEEQRGHW